MPTTQTSTAPPTLLEAVNELLRTIRVSAVMSLQAADLNGDAEEALSCLSDASVSFQSRGWLFNTETATLDPTESGEVFVPGNILKVRSVRCSAHPRLVLRGNRLYSPDRRTFRIAATVGVELVLALPYEELTAPARAYVVALAASRFAPPKLPSGATFRYTEQFLAEALAALEEADGEGRDEDLKQTSPHFAAMARR